MLSKLESVSKESNRPIVNKDAKQETTSKPVVSNDVQNTMEVKEVCKTDRSERIRLESSQNRDMT